MICIRMLVLLVVSLPQVKLGPDASYMLPISRSGTSLMQDAARTPSIPNLKLKIAVAAASDRRSAERRCEHRQASAGLPYRDNLSDEVGEYDDDMLRPW
jgi:hypothetical protein